MNISPSHRQASVDLNKLFDTLLDQVKILINSFSTLAKESVPQSSNFYSKCLLILDSLIISSKGYTFALKDSKLDTFLNLNEKLDNFRKFLEDEKKKSGISKWFSSMADFEKNAWKKLSGTVLS